MSINNAVNIVQYKFVMGGDPPLSLSQNAAECKNEFTYLENTMSSTSDKQDLRN